MNYGHCIRRNISIWWLHATADYGVLEVLIYLIMLLICGNMLSQHALARRRQWLATAKQHIAAILQDAEGLLQFEFSR